MLKKDENNLVWLDLEMTGLDPAQDVILEIATIVTSADLKDWVEGPNLVVHQDEEKLALMNDWVREQHGKSGLTDRVRQSTVTVAQAEKETLDFLSQYVKSGISPLCGNTVSQDRRFLWPYMPQLQDFFHYRHIDVSTLKELAKRWKPTEYQEQTEKESAHRALDDIYESIEELRYYRRVLMQID